MKIAIHAYFMENTENVNFGQVILVSSMAQKLLLDIIHVFSDGSHTCIC